MTIIDIEGLTKDYGHGRGVFDLHLHLDRGEVLGFLGPNGAGKTTTIRHLMGFMRADAGVVRMLDMDCFSQRSSIQPHVGYLPGEVSLIDDMTGASYLRFVARLKGMEDRDYRRRASQLIERFDLDPSGKIRKMSKGTKQKVGIIAAFMGRPEILLLDEPTSGLDPLMQGRFLELIAQEKARGATIVLSSHVFEEIERSCEKVAFIRAGRLIDTLDLAQVHHERHRTCILSMRNAHEARRYQDFLSTQASCLLPGRAAASDINEGDNQAGSIRLSDDQGDASQVVLTVRGEIGPLLASVQGFDVTDLQILTPSLEDMFLGYYRGDNPASITPRSHRAGM